jgi:hypothetical protein
MCPTYGCRSRLEREEAAMTTTNGTSGLADLVDMARECVKAGTIGNLDTPAVLRQIAREDLGFHLPATAQADLLKPEHLSKVGELVVAEFEVRPCVRGIWLTKAIHDDHRLVAIGAFERACHRMLVKVVRRLVRLVATPIQVFRVPELQEPPLRTVRRAEPLACPPRNVGGSMVLVRQTRTRRVA